MTEVADVLRTVADVMHHRLHRPTETERNDEFGLASGVQRDACGDTD